MASLVTGATGFIGRNLLQEFVRRGEKVLAISRAGSAHRQRCEQLISWHKPPTSTEEWLTLLTQVSTVYHLAWSSLPQSSNADPLSDASDNILGSLQLLEAARRAPHVRFVFPSSGGTVYGLVNSASANEKQSTNPRCAYGVSKLAIEKYVYLYHELWALDCVTLRISNAYGPGQQTGRNFGAISTFAACAVAREPITVFGDGSIIRDYIYIDDLVRAFVAAGNHRGSPIVMNIGSGIGKSLNDIIEVLRQLFRPIEVKYVPGRDFDVPVSVLDVSLAKATLGWMPSVSFEEGVERTVNALRGHSPRRDENQLLGCATAGSPHRTD